jgi:organic radical activating enzyme
MSRSISHTGKAREEHGAQTAVRGHFSELFCSVQGEGLFVGERHIFVRTAGCVATCEWCDTVYSKVRTPRFVIHAGAHDQPARWRPNPVAMEDVLADVLDMAKANAPVSTVSITGGEPLEQPQAVRALAGALRERGLAVYLETAGLHADALASLIDDIDVIATDVKLESATGINHAPAHREFLRVVRESCFDPSRDGARPVFVKVVVDLKATTGEIEAAARLVADASRKIPFIIQPESETLMGRQSTRERRASLLELVQSGARAAAIHLDTVRVIPQTHKVLHLR